VVRRLGSVLIVPCLLLVWLVPSAGATAVGAAASDTAARLARPTLKVTVDWPAAPVRGKRVTVHVTRPGTRPTTAELQIRVGREWATVKRKTVSTRTFVFRPVASVNRYKLRVVLPSVSSRGYAAPVPAPLVRRVGYAAGPVRHRVSGQQLTLLLAGTRGHHVELATGPGCRTTRLRAPSGTVVPQRAGMWRLPRTATYRVEVVPCWGSDVAYADLTRVRLVPLAVNAVPVLLHRRDGVADVAAVTVPKSGRVLVRGWQTGTRAWSTITCPSGTRVSSYDRSPTHLVAGQSLYDGFHSCAVVPGRYLFRPAVSDLKASVSTPVAAAATPEGPAVTLGDGGVPGRERLFTFTGTAGSFIYPEPALPTVAVGGAGWLTGPDGATVGDWNYHQGWLLPRDGTYTLQVTPGTADAEAGAPVTMRVRQAVTLPPMRYGTPTRFTVDEQDRWLVASVAVPWPPYSHQFAASGSTMSGPWEAIVGFPTTNYCGPGPGPNGCGDNFFTTVNQATPAATYRPWAGSTPSIVVLRPAGAVTGGVDLTLGPPPTS
jgi:hypothetical protein